MTAGTEEREHKLRTGTRVAPDAFAKALAAALADTGATAGAAVVTLHTDTYLDDARGSLQQHRTALRVRRHRDRAVVCCKDRGRREGSLHIRHETEADWPGPALPTGAAALPPAIADLVAPLVRDREFAPLAQLDVHRQVHALHRGDATIGELAIDRCTASARGRTTTFFEVELEVHGDPPACATIAERLQHELAMEVAATDKLTWALTWLELLPATHTATAPPATLGEFVGARLGSRLRRIARAERAVRTAGAADDIHRLRVELRHARTLLRAFRALWPAEAAAAAEAALARFARDLGALRNHDVYALRTARLIARLPAALTAGGTALPAEQDAQRAALLQQVQQRLRGADHAAELGRIELLADHASMQPELRGLPAHAAAVRLHKAARSVRQRIRALAPQPEPDDLHELRLALKRLRILAAEVQRVGPRLPGRQRRLLRRAVEQLGTVCDRRDLVARFLERLAALGPTGSPAEAAFVAAVATAEWSTIADATATALRRVRRLDRRRFWQAFRPPA